VYIVLKLVLVHVVVLVLVHIVIVGHVHCVCPGAHVTLTDRPLALPVLHQNIAINAVDNILVRELTWGQKNLDQLSASYDIILGADIVYIEQTFSDLLDTIDQLSNNATVVLLACQIRYDRDLIFLDMLRKRFTVQSLHRDRGVEIFTARKLLR